MFYEPVYDGADLVAIHPTEPGVPELVEKRTIADLAEWPYPKNQLVPLTEVVHDRLNVEVFRGCTRGCRFCQAGMITRPVRERPADQVRSMIQSGLQRTGYDEVALTSLSTADYSGIQDSVKAAMDDDAPGCGRVSVSLPSLRVDAFTVGIAAEIQRARRTGLTFAPEAGTWRMRQVINKLISEDDLYGAVESAYSQGWRRMKLYFLTGLPTETDEDTLGIARLARNCVELGRSHTNKPSMTVSVGGFVPKPFTPFQWFGQNTDAELRRKVGLLRDDLKRDRGVQLKWHDPTASLVEGLMSPWRPPPRAGPRGRLAGRRHLPGVVRALRHAPLDRRHGQARPVHGLVRPPAPPPRTRSSPWDHLSAGLHKDFLWQDWRDALDEVGLEDCRWTPCYDCGACTGYGIEHIVASAKPPAGAARAPVRAWSGTAPCPSSSGPNRSAWAREHRPDRPGRRREGARLRRPARSDRPLPLHQAGQGPLHQPPRRGPPVGAGAAPRRRRRGLQRGLLAPTPRSPSGWPCPPATPPTVSTSTSASTMSPPKAFLFSVPA